ncbi:MAG TPA: glycosyltransferase family 2 protein [Alphaproteobacteria bacterium]|nr:glycosyltransferase family 2 protein [Alphaproteobacteria bacterium]
MQPLVSILVGAFNAEKTIAETLESALRQTWPHTEIIVADDGSTDRTREIVRQYENVRLIPAEHGGVSAAVNIAFSHSRGDYIQYLDSDDLLAPDKIESQLLALQKRKEPRLVASSSWAYFFHRTRKARFVRNSLCEDLSPVEWLIRKMSEGVFMGNGTWLVKRELVEKAGPWNTDLYYDQDGEFFCRVLLASEGTCFVPATGMYYRRTGSSSTSFIGKSDKKKESLLASLKLHTKYLLSIEDSERTRAACARQFQNWFYIFYQSRPDLAAEMESQAASFGGRLTPPELSWKYAWIQKVWDWQTAAAIQMNYNNFKARMQRVWDNAMYNWERGPLGRA